MANLLRGLRLRPSIVKVERLAVNRIARETERADEWRRRAEAAEAALLRLRQHVADLGRDAERGGGYWTAIKDVLACLDTLGASK